MWLLAYTAKSHRQNCAHCDIYEMISESLAYLIVIAEVIFNKAEAIHT